MRIPLVAAIAAAALSAPAHAAGPGVGAVALSGTSFFRPQNGVAVTGLCTYDGYVLAGVAVGVTVTPGNTEYTTITCELRDGFGTIDTASDTGGDVAVADRVQTLGGRTPTTICGRAEAKSTAWSGVAVGTGCAAVLPGNVN